VQEAARTTLLVHAAAVRHTRRAAAHTRAVAADRAAQHRFQALVEHSSDAIALLDRYGRRLYASSGNARLLGVEQAELVGQLALDRVHPDDVLRLRGVFAGLLTDPGGEVPWECRLRHADGTWRWVEGTATNLLADPDVDAVVINFRDVTERIAAHTALAARERRFRALVEHSAEGIAIVDPSGNVRYASPAAERIVGHASTGVFGADGFDRIHPEDQAAARAVLAWLRLHPGESRTDCCRVRHDDGSWRWLETTATNHLDNPDVGGVVVNCRDVTEREANAATLRESENRFHALWDIAVDGMTLTDEHGMVLLANPAYCALYRVPLEAVVGRPFSIIFPEGARIRTTEQYGVLFHSESNPPMFEATVRRGDGTERIVETHVTFLTQHGRRVAMLSVTRDITERNLAQAEVLTANQQLRVALAELAASRIRLHDVFMQAPAIIATVREPNHVFELVNPHYVQLVGRTDAAELVGKPILEALPELEDQGYIALLDQAYATGEPFVGTEMAIRLRRGNEDVLEEVYVTFAIQPSRGTTGAVNGLLMYATEVTAQVRARQQLIQQERLRALGEMASGIAHDFNNSLTPVLGYSEILLASPEILQDRAKAHRYLTLINTSAQDAAAVVGRLREFYRRRDADEVHQAVDVAAVVEHVIELTQPRWRDQAQAHSRTIHVETALEPVPAAAAQPFALREALTNLVFNAIDALPHGGTITLGCRLDAPRGPGPVTEARVAITVRDTGIGMPDDVRSRCLEPFFTTKGVAGSGLGLSMVFGTAQRWGGNLTVASAPGQGTTITLFLPVFQLASAAAAAPTVAAPGRALHVLVVDDEPGVLAVTTACLQVDGHTVTTADGGRAALAELRDGHFDLVITDRAMPDMSGEQLAQAIKAVAPRVPVIMLTGFGNLMRASNEQPAGVDALAAKPITLAALRQALELVCAASSGTSA
jgi:PAS domain S-box-containing protein